MLRFTHHFYVFPTSFHTEYYAKVRVIKIRRFLFIKSLNLIQQDLKNANPKIVQASLKNFILLVKNEFYYTKYTGGGCLNYSSHLYFHSFHDSYTEESN